jgi:hypothetical protein
MQKVPVNINEAKQDQYHKWCKVRTRLINRYTNDKWWPRTEDQKIKAQKLLHNLNEWIEMELDIYDTIGYIDFSENNGYSRPKTNEDRLLKLEQANKRRII